MKDDLLMGIAFVAVMMLAGNQAPVWLAVVLSIVAGVVLIAAHRRWTLDVLGTIVRRRRCAECERCLWRRPVRTVSMDGYTYGWCSVDCWESAKSWRSWVYRNSIVDAGEVTR